MTRDWFPTTLGIWFSQLHFNTFYSCQSPIFASDKFYWLGKEAVFCAFLARHPGDFPFIGQFILCTVAEAGYIFRAKSQGCA